MRQIRSAVRRWVEQHKDEERTPDPIWFETAFEVYRSEEPPHLEFSQFRKRVLELVDEYRARVVFVTWAVRQWNLVRAPDERPEEGWVEALHGAYSAKSPVAVSLEEFRETLEAAFGSED